MIPTIVVKAGSTDVTTYWHFKNASDGTDATGKTITTFDLTYVRTREEPAAKVDATALSDQDDAHTDNAGIEIDSTNMPGVYRFDWPDAAFASGASAVILTIKQADIVTESIRFQLEATVASDLATQITDVQNRIPASLGISGTMMSDMRAILGTQLDGSGTASDPWGPAT